MISLQRLTLHILIACVGIHIDPLDLIEQLTIGMSQLRLLSFYARATNDVHQPDRCSIRHGVQRHAPKGIYGHVYDVVVRQYSKAFYHVFTLPFQFTQLNDIGRGFPETQFQHVVSLLIKDVGQFDHNFFVRVARCFPVLQQLLVDEGTSTLCDELDELPTIRSDQLVHFSHVHTLCLVSASLNCIEQFLNENYTRLPRLAQLEIMYDQLRTVTHEFTRQETRRNCAHVTELTTAVHLARSRHFYDHFPSL